MKPSHCAAAATFSLAFAMSLGSTNNASAQSLPSPEIWEVPTYGYVLAANRGSWSIYSKSGSYCAPIMQLPASAFATQIGTRSEEASTDTVVFSTSVSRYRANRLAQLPTQCAQPKRSRDHLVTFDAVWTAMNDHYGFFDVRGMDWAQARLTYRPRAQVARSPDELWTILTEMLAPLRDAHVSLQRRDQIWSQARSNKVSVADPDGIIPNGRPLIAGLQAWLAGAETPLTTPPTVHANSRIMSGVTKQGICYIAVTGMAGYTGAGEAMLDQELPVLANALDAIATQCVGTKGTIVDLRYNPGGDDRLGIEIASRFVSEDRPAWQKRAFGPGGWTPYAMASVRPTTRARLPSPVAVIIGERTISAAETTAVALQSAANAVTVGSAAQGALLDILSKPLPNGWTLGLSNEDYAKPDGKRLEGAGLQPDIRIEVSSPATTSQRFGGEIIAATEALLASHQGTPR